VLGRSAVEFWDEPALAAGVVEDLFARGRWFGELTARRRGDRRFVAQLSATLIRDSLGRAVSMIASFVDISEQKEHERTLRENESKYRSLIEGARDMIFRMTIPAGSYEFVSPSAEHVIGYTAQQLLDEPLLIAMAIHPESREFFEREWDKLQHGIVAPRYEYSIVDSQGPGGGCRSRTSASGIGRANWSRSKAFAETSQL
jgi:PAS domain S-box-containing protein